MSDEKIKIGTWPTPELPEFAELLRRKLPPVWDPVPWALLFKLIKEEKLVHVVRLQLKHNRRVMESQIEMLGELEQILGK